MGATLKMCTYISRQFIENVTNVFHWLYIALNRHYQLEVDNNVNWMKSA